MSVSRRLVVCLIVTASILGILSSKRSPHVVWNRSQSLPTGLYTIQSSSELKRHDIVLVAPHEWVQMAVERGYLERDTPLLKTILAVSGDVICRNGLQITVNGTPKALAKSADRQNNPMPEWAGCQRLESNQIFVLNDHFDSFDGRYLGPIDIGDVVGVAKK